MLWSHQCDNTTEIDLITNNCVLYQYCFSSISVENIESVSIYHNGGNKNAPLFNMPLS